MRRQTILLALLINTAAFAAPLPANAVQASRDGRWSEAVTLWQAAAHSDPDNPDVAAELGRAEMENGESPDARRDFNHALRLDPNNVKAQVGLVTIALRELRVDDALTLATTLAHGNPKSGVAYRTLGDAQKASAHRSDAESSYRKAVALDPNDPLSHAALGDALLIRRKSDEALREYREAVRIEPGNGAIQEGFGRAAVAAQHSGEAAAAFASAMEAARKPVPDWTRLDTLSLLAIDALGRTETDFAAGTGTRQDMYDANTRAQAVTDALLDMSAIKDADPLTDVAMTQRGLAYSLIGQAAASDLAALRNDKPQQSADAVVFREQARRAIVSARAASRQSVDK